MLHLYNTDTLIEQTKEKSQKTLEIKMNYQMQTFSFDPAINLVQEGKWFLAVTSFETTNSVLNITNENNSFSIWTAGHWSSEDDKELITNLKIKLEPRSENYVNLPV